MEVTIKLPDDLGEVAQACAARIGCSLDCLILQSLELHLRRQGDWPTLEVRLRAQQKFLENWADHSFDPEETRRIQARIDEE